MADSGTEGGTEGGVERAGEQRPDPAGAAARSMTQLAQQMKEMADRMLGAGLPGWPIPGGGRAGPRPGAGGRGVVGCRVRRCPFRARSFRGRRTGTPRGPRDAADAGHHVGPPGAGDRRRHRRPPHPGPGAVTQLEVFDEQLATLETSLQPLLQWLRTWSDLEGAVTDFWTPRPPKS